jgi:hypothetical protein
MRHKVKRVILLEFNELSPSLMEHFLSKGLLPNFQRLRDESHCYLTDADARPPYLEPWIQWTTVHSGITHWEHGVTRLDAGHKLKHKCIWDLLSDAGRRVWVCGAMNARYDAALTGAFLPDPWASQIEPRPKALTPFYEFIKKNVQGHTSEEERFSARDYMKFLAFMLGHGLSVSTVTRIVRQLLAERRGMGRWRRAILLDLLQFDIFRSYFHKLRPDFSLFFSNSTAHFQHTYWRNMDPGPFRVKPTLEEQTKFGDAVMFGYQQMDCLIGEFLRLGGDSAALIFTTALGQQPCLIYEEDGGKFLHRPRNFAALLAFVGVTNYTEVAPVMAEEFYVRFEDEREASKAEESLRTLNVCGSPVMRVDRRGNEVFCGCQIYKPLPQDAIMMVRDSSRSTSFHELFYQIEGLKSGMHHPDGMLWIRFPSKEHRSCHHKVSLMSIAPTILNLLAVATPDYMRGQSLLEPATAHV